MSLTPIIASPLVGQTNVGELFNDLKANEIVKISKLEVLWLTEPSACVSGLNVTYLVRDGELIRPVEVQHGRGEPGPEGPLILDEKEYIVGLIGLIEGGSSTDGTILNLTFPINSETKGLTEYRPTPPNGAVPKDGATVFGFLGLTYAFGGKEWGSTGTMPAIQIYYQPGVAVPGAL